VNSLQFLLIPQWKYCRPQNAWECLSRANNERNFAHMLEVIYRTERFFTRKFEVTFRSKQIVI